MIRKRIAKAYKERITFQEEPTIYALGVMIVVATVIMAIINPILAVVVTLLSLGAIYAEKQTDKERQRGIEINVKLAFLFGILHMQNQKRGNK